MKLQLPATISGFRTMADNGVRITIDTQELEPDAYKAIGSLVKKFGWLLFSENIMKEEDVPDEQAPEFKGEKSPSQRLRACLYKYWELNTNQSKTFNSFYNDWIEKKTKEIKELLT